ncbi:Batten's disease protein Cln3 [Carpediemonas membranifera]|uniref:Batten's disease protein Cln3 n=1 Tax=Carpediemonas membranifera TaxID=201153 RepID=A0A8J6B2M3_9EUKA|nr:Batten's disease protein Cln3 [Carpediemonas membranifera]|eukprot:KAG9392929.1 Batten's disease protein Cln3 [Carpediemonas membranifera]
MAECRKHGSEPQDNDSNSLLAHDEAIHKSAPMKQHSDDKYRLLGRLEFFHEHPTITYMYNFLWFFILGTLNNFGYSIVLAAARSVAEDFNQLNMLGFVPWANVGVGLLVRPLNVAMERVPFTARFLLNAILMFLGPSLLALSIWTDITFVFCILSILVVGASSSFGESVLLTYMRLYDARSVNGWSSGTGMAGVSSALAYLVATWLEIPDQLTFVVIAFLAGIYVLSFALLVRPRPCPRRADSDPEEAVEPFSEDVLDGLTPDAVEQADPTPAVPVIDRVIAYAHKLWVCTKHASWNGGLLAAVYFFEYVSLTGCAAKAQPADDGSAKTKYVVLQLSYQIGVFLSRSSLLLFKIRYVWILAAMQAVNFAAWQLQAYTKIVPFAIQIPAMFYVGLLGGAMYVNVLYFTMADARISKNHMELTINLITIFICLGITASSIYDLVIDHTFLADK